MKNKLRVLLPFLIIILFTAPSCKKPGNPVTPPVEEKPKLALSLDDTTCIEAWLKLSIENGPLPAGIIVKQDGGRARQYMLYRKDTVLYYDSLLPMRNYNYTAILVTDTSVNQKLTLRTMDTTSHNYTWQVWELGDGPSDKLYDAAILDDNNIWAVGSVSIADSSGRPYYNLLKWNGNDWHPDNVYSGGATPGLLGSIDLIYSFSKNDVWLGNYTHWNGTEFTKISKNIEFPTLIYGLWGKNWQDITVVGVNGLMAQYNGSGWTKLPVLTSYFLNDIYGNKSNDDVFVIGGDPATGTGTVLQRKQGVWSELIRGDNTYPLPEGILFKTKLYGDFTSVWVDQKGKLYVAGGFAYAYSRGTWNYLDKLPLTIQNSIPNRNGWSYLYSMRGNASNDFIIAGELNTLQHFNGYSWRQVGPPFNSIIYKWRKVEMKGNTAVAVGYRNNKAVIMLLKR